MQVAIDHITRDVAHKALVRVQLGPLLGVADDVAGGLGGVVEGNSVLFHGHRPVGVDHDPVVGRRGVGGASRVFLLSQPQLGQFNSCRGFVMSIRFIAAMFTPLALALGLSWGCSSAAPAPPPLPPPVTVTVPAPPPVPPPAHAPPPAEDSESAESESESGDNSGAEFGSSAPYDNCRWDESTGWFCRHSVEGGYFNVPDDDPGIGRCAGMPYAECNGEEQSGSTSSTSTLESESGSSESGQTDEGPLETKCSDSAWRQANGTAGDQACGSTDRPK